MKLLSWRIPCASLVEKAFPYLDIMRLCNSLSILVSLSLFSRTKLDQKRLCLVGERMENLVIDKKE